MGATWARNPIPVVASWRPGCKGGNATHGITNDDTDPGTHPGTREHYAAVSGTVSTDPAGQPCRQFDPPCPGDHGWRRNNGSTDPTDVAGECSHNWIGGMIVDQVRIPAGLAPGAYVLGFRWDGEQTSQVWSSCADVTLVSEPPPPTLSGAANKEGASKEGASRGQPRGIQRRPTESS